MTRWLLPLRIVLAILAEAARCFRAQPLTNAQGASEHLRTQVTAAELFYLRHLRTCAASASGSRSTCSATTPGLCTSGLLLLLDCMSLVKVVLQDMRQALEFVMSMFVKVLRSTLQILEQFMKVLRSTLHIHPASRSSNDKNSSKWHPVTFGRNLLRYSWGLRWDLFIPFFVEVSRIGLCDKIWFVGAAARHVRRDTRSVVGLSHSVSRMCRIGCDTLSFWHRR